MKTVVFDFDKTLTNYDTLTDLFLFCMKKKKIKYILFPVYFSFKVLAKFKIISVKKEKELALKLLVPDRIDLFNQLCAQFAETIRFNEVYSILLKEKNVGNRVIVLSASPENYLKLLFPNLEIFGFILNEKAGLIKGIKQHPYAAEKKEVLLKNAITHVDEMYYDSLGDESLIPLCDNWYKVKQGKIISKNTKA